MRSIDRRQNMALKTFGTMAVDWEERVNFDRLRNDRLASAEPHLMG